MKEAYRQKGWALKNAEQIVQCQRDGYVSQLAEQKNEGCRVFGYLEVNRVSRSFQLHLRLIMYQRLFSGGAAAAVRTERALFAGRRS